MMRLSLVFLSLLFGLRATQTQAAAPAEGSLSKAYILCISDDTRKFSYLMTESAKPQRVKVQASFDRRLGYYRLNDELFWELTGRCQAQLKQLGLRFIAMQASFRVEIPLSSWSLGIGTYALVPHSFHEQAVHVPTLLRNDPELPNAEVGRAALRALMKLDGSYEFPFDPVHGDEFRTLEKLAVQMAQEADVDLTRFDRGQLLKDLERDSLQIFWEQGAGQDPRLLYRKKDYKIADLLNHMYVRPQKDVNRDLFVEMPYAILEDVLSYHELVASMNELTLRRHIALALETRAQTFEASATLLLNNILLNYGPGIRWIVGKTKKDGEGRHTITISGRTLKMKSEVPFQVGYVDPVAYDAVYIGSPIYSVRELSMDIVTGKFGIEKVRLSREPIQDESWEVIDGPAEG